MWLCRVTLCSLGVCWIERKNIARLGYYLTVVHAAFEESQLLYENRDPYLDFIKGMFEIFNTVFT